MMHIRVGQFNRSMILFYSEFCQHCTVLLDTVRKFDKGHAIKLISIDTLRSLKKTIDPRIHSVPALYIIETKKYLFGKEVFDFLILQNKATLSGENTREAKNIKEPVQPSAFTLGSISAESFATIEDNTHDMIADKTYKWDFINNDANITGATSIEEGLNVTGNISNPVNQVATTPVTVNTQQNEYKLPSMEEIMKRRATDIL